MKAELQWWIAEVRQWNGKPIISPVPDMTIETDASLLGWGATVGETSTGGLWTEEERKHHINWLELQGGVFAARTFAKDKSNIHVRLRTDNTTVIAYINHLGGRRSQALAHSACQLWQWCLHRGITLSAEHLPGTSNCTADRESHTYHSSAEWKLHTAVCTWIF